MLECCGLVRATLNQVADTLERLAPLLVILVE